MGTLIIFVFVAICVTTLWCLSRPKIEDLIERRKFDKEKSNGKYIAERGSCPECSYGEMIKLPDQSSNTKIIAHCISCGSTYEIYFDTNKNIPKAKKIKERIV